MAPAIKIPKVEKTNTPKGMEGVRPGSPKAIKAGYKPPTTPRRPGGSRTPFAVSFNADGTTTLKPPTPPSAPSVAAPPTPPAAASTPVVDANWWTRQITSDPRFTRTDYLLRGQQNALGTKYGLSIKRDANGNPVFKSRTNSSLTGITQSGYDDAGRAVYKTSTGTVVPIGDLEMEFVEIMPGEAGYGSTLVGSTNLTSQGRQYNIGDVAARSGVGRSGMRASSSAQEASALQSALRNLGLSAASEYAGIDQRYADLYNTIFEDLSKVAGDIVPTAPTAPAATPAPAAPAAAPPPVSLGYNQAPPPPPGTLGAGPGGAFMTLVGDITLERNTNDAAIRQGLRALLNNPAYQLTAQQKAYINSLITGRYKGNKKY